MQKFFYYAKDLTNLKENTKNIFEKLEENIKNCNTKSEKIYSLPNFFILFYKLEKIR